MDLTTTEMLDRFFDCLPESIETLIDSHPGSLDKRAAMLTVAKPKMHRQEDRIELQFTVTGYRQDPTSTSILLVGDAERTFESGNLPIEASVDCQCESFSNTERCCHSLAASWWLQEQLGRRSAAELIDQLNVPKLDPVSVGCQAVDQWMEFANQVNSSTSSSPDTRLQWRIAFIRYHQHQRLSITPYLQRPRKNGGGWTKGREARFFDVMQRDFHDNPTDGRIAALVARHGYSVETDQYRDFQVFQLLIGHDNVVWNDSRARKVHIESGDLALTLEPVDAPQVAEAEDRSVRDESIETSTGPGDNERNTTDSHPSIDENAWDQGSLFQPRLVVNQTPVDLSRCAVLLGCASPVDPMAVIVDESENRLFVCALRNPATIELLKRITASELSTLRLDAETAAQFVVNSKSLDALVPLRLPDALAGSVEPVTTELVIELRPRAGAGLNVALMAYDDRFRECLQPGTGDAIVYCYTDRGPLRLQRDLPQEREHADAMIERFGLNELPTDGPDRWVAESDEAALDLLTRLAVDSDDAPRIIWPEGETIRVRDELRPGNLRVQVEDGRDWFGLSGSIAVDGQQIPLQQLLTAVHERRQLVRVGDRTFARISEEFQKRLEQLGDAVLEMRGGLKVADAAVPMIHDLIAEDVILDASTGWHESLQRLEQLKAWDPEKPSQLKATLRDYQLEGYRWLARLSAWGVGGVLADDMGLGKTVQALGVLLDRGGDGPALVVAPTSVGDNWVRETERFAPTLRPHLYRDSDRQELIDSAGPHDLVIVSYQLLQRDAKRFASRAWHTLVLDEAQFIKNAQTKTSQAVRKIQADWRIGLSGTPLENHLGELWSLFRTLSPGLLGSWERFRDRFAEPIERHKDPKRRESLARLVRPYILRRTKDKVLDELPPRTEVTLLAELSPKERQRYDEVRTAALADLNGLTDDPNEGRARIRTLAWLTQLRQLACHPRLIDSSWSSSSAKLDLLMSLVQELREEDHRALVFSQFVKHLSVVRESLDQHGITYQYLDGRTPAKERQRRVDAFQDGQGDLFLISLKAGGTGLNLTGADYVIHLDPWWNPAVEDQATDRAHRIGQQRPVTVYRLVAQDTIEQQILQLHADKRELVAGVLDGTDQAARMKTEDLVRLIREGGHG